jgi:hypothetical protein
VTRFPKRPVRASAMQFAFFWFITLSVMLTLGPSIGETPAGVRIESVYWPTRSGISTRVLGMLPKEDRGGVILLPGGHGNINLNSQAHIGWGLDDFVVRTRIRYAMAGFVTVIPDVPIDRKPPADLGDYRRSDVQAGDLAAIVGRLRRTSGQVFIIAYDRGVTSALNAAGRGKMDADGLVLISPILEPGETTILDDGARSAFAARSVLLIGHSSDECSAEAMNHLKAIAAGQATPNFKAILVRGGPKQYQLQDPLAYHHDGCNKKAPHALAGLDEDVSPIIVRWLDRLTSPKQ